MSEGAQGIASGVRASLTQYSAVEEKAATVREHHLHVLLDGREPFALHALQKVSNLRPVHALLPHLFKIPGFQYETILLTILPQNDIIFSILFTVQGSLAAPSELRPGGQAR